MHKDNFKFTFRINLHLRLMGLTNNLNEQMTKTFFLASVAKHQGEVADVSGRIRVGVTLRLAVYRQSVRLGAKPLENHDQRSPLPS
jgi:hypothetical protein